MAHEHQERYSSLVLAKMRAENILKDGIIFNNDYEGDPVSGAVKVPVRDDEVKVGDYDRTAGGELSEGSTIYRTILINREKYVNELIDGYDAASVPDNLVADRLDSAGYSMARVMDSDGASALISQGTRVNLSSLSASTIYSEVVGIRSRMSKANVPNDGRRYLLVTPDVYAEMLKSEQFVKASDLGAEMIQTGALGRMAGFNIYEWNDSTANLAMIAGHPRYAITFTAYAVNNLCYKANRRMPAGSPAGIIVHSTGANNPNLRRYVNAPEICGKNPYKNYFDRPDVDVCPHGVVGLDKDGKVRAAKLLPWTMCCWGCGDGSKGSYNYAPAYIQIEICEDDLTDKVYFTEVFKLTAQLCARLMKNYPTIKLNNIISHKEACARGYASNHGDCDHWLAKFGKNMDWFRELVANGGEEVVRYKVTGTKTVTKSDLGKAQAQLIALGFDVDAEVL